MIDLIHISLLAGNGGNGRISFRREKYVAKGGPDGGTGGNGGSIIVRGRKGLSTLNRYSGVKKIEAKNGQSGGAKKMTGAQAEDVVIEVPLGTVIWATGGNKAANRRFSYFGNLEHTFKRGEVTFEKFYVEKEGQRPEPREIDEIDTFDKKVTLAKITEDGQEFVLCQGGFGGRGNVHFKGPANTTPLEAEFGTFGERRQVTLELKLLADVGLVGFPNAGKSTLLSKITRAQPKIANYPFTTLEPNLGVMRLDGPQNTVKELVLADIPGLIEGASQGKGLGLDFLRHVENCRVLMFVLYLSEDVVFDSEVSDEEKADLLLKQYKDLQKELVTYHPDLAKKPSVLTLNKIDIYSSKLLDTIRSTFIDKNMILMPFSGVTGDGLDAIQSELWRLQKEEANT